VYENEQAFRAGYFDAAQQTATFTFFDPATH
jgi:hypothetical protein